jgi:hypothetical protein
MFIATTHLLKYSSLREERNVFPAGQSGYKHLAPLGRNPIAFNSFHFQVEFALHYRCNASLHLQPASQMCKIVSLS